MSRSDFAALMAVSVMILLIGLVLAFILWMLTLPHYSPPDPHSSLNMTLRYCEATSQLPLAIGSRFSPGQFLACLQEYGYHVS